MGRGPEAEGWWELKHRLEWREHLLGCVCGGVPWGGVVFVPFGFPKVCVSFPGLVDVL